MVTNQTQHGEELELEMRRRELEDESNVEDESSTDPQDVIPDYRMIAYGADFDVAGLIARLESGEIEIPKFQREYVWTRRQASRFIESILIGLPIPGIFLWRDPETQKFTVVDGGQRLRTLLYFKQGLIRDRAFSLPEETSKYQKMNPRFQKRTYKTLDEEDRRTFDNTIIHATIVSQEKPPGDDSSIFYLFERINTEGTALAAEEIRTAIYKGELIHLLSELNSTDEWRAVYGEVSPRMKDRELIARFLALFERSNDYARPMKEFLNQYYNDHQTMERDELEALRRLFAETISTVSEALGKEAFRPSGTLNAAVYDCVMVGLARRLQRGPIGELANFRSAYHALLQNEDFKKLYSRSTADADNVKKRLDMATQAFAEVA